MSTKPRPDLIAIVGAGLGGIAMGVQLKRLLGYHEFRLYDKDSRVGGTWSQNTYPNLSCDVPSEYYSYSFFQSPNWSEKFASQPEILSYIEDCVTRFDLSPHLRLSQECMDATWQKDLKLWLLTFRDTTSLQTYQVQARYLITAVGIFNIPKGLDDLPLLREFSGPVFHTSQWRDVEFENKRVLVVGNGCSANQVIPWVLKNRAPAKLTQIVRSAHWVMPKPNYAISTLTKWILRYVPFAMTFQRFYIALQLDLGFRAFYNDAKGKRLRDGIGDGIRKFMQSTANPKYHSILVPNYEFGSKRPILDHGYLAATNDPGFELIRCDGLKSIEGPNKNVIVDQAGNRHETDIVILANGFKTQELLTPMDVLGLNDQNLRELWKSKGGSEAYMGVSVHQFPNFFMLGGPNTLPSLNSTLQGIECSVVYITRVLGRLLNKPPSSQHAEVVSIMPTAEAQERHNAELQAAIGKLIYTKDVNTYVINPDSGKNTLVWPGTQFALWWDRCMKSVRWSDWAIST